MLLRFHFMTIVRSISVDASFVVRKMVGGIHNPRPGGSTGDTGYPDCQNGITLKDVKRLVASITPGQGGALGTLAILSVRMASL